MTHPAPTGPATVSDAVTEVEARLLAAGVPSPDVDARRLVALATGLSAAGLVAHGRDAVDGEAAARLDEITQRRAGREPLQWIEGEAAFLDFTVTCGEGVLVPRPDTETTAEVAIACAGEQADRIGAPRGDGLCLLDCGTGTGVLAIALARAFPGAEVHATERSMTALVWASRNLSRLAPHVVLHENWYLGAPGSFHVIVSNPPYVSGQEWETLEPEVRDHDPRTALVAAGDGLAAHRQLAELTPERLAPGGHLVLEIGASQAGAVTELLEDRGFADVAVHRDLGGRDRVVSARLPRSATGFKNGREGDRDRPR